LEIWRKKFYAQAMGNRLYLIFLVVLTLVGCNAAPAQMSPAGYVGRTFLLQSTQGEGLPAKGTVRLRFWESDMSFTAYCNQMWGQYAIEEERIVLSYVAKTEASCGAEQHDQEEWLRRFFQSKPKLVHQGNTLTLSNGVSTLAFLDREIADPDRPLTGTIWQVSWFINEETDRAWGAREVESPRLTFAKDGTWQARSRCLNFSGRYTADQVRIQLADTYAAQACGFYDREAADLIRSLLVDGELTYQIEAGRMDLIKYGLGGFEAYADETKLDRENLKTPTHSPAHPE
jgi:heat shock protein HslJ